MKRLQIIILLAAFWGCDLGFESPADPYHLADYYPLTRTNANGFILQMDHHQWSGLGRVGQKSTEAIQEYYEKNKPLDEAVIAPPFPNPAAVTVKTIAFPHYAKSAHELSITDSRGRVVFEIKYDHGFEIPNIYFWNVQQTKSGLYKVIFKAGSKQIYGNIVIE